VERLIWALEELVQDLESAASSRPGRGTSWTTSWRRARRPCWGPTPGA